MSPVIHKTFDELDTKYSWTNVAHFFQETIFKDLQYHGKRGDDDDDDDELTAHSLIIIEDLSELIKLWHRFYQHQSFDQVKTYIFNDSTRQDLYWVIYYDFVLNTMHQRYPSVLNHLLYQSLNRISLDKCLDKTNWFLQQNHICMVKKFYANNYILHIIKDDQDNFWFDVEDLKRILRLPDIMDDVSLIVSYYSQAESQYLYNEMIINEFCLYILLVSNKHHTTFINFIYMSVLPELKGPERHKQENCLICLYQLDLQQQPICFATTVDELNPMLDWSSLISDDFKFNDIICTNKKCYNSVCIEDGDEIIKSIHKYIKNIHWIFTTDRFEFILKGIKEKLHQKLYKSIYYDGVINNLGKRNKCALNYLLQKFINEDISIVYYNELEQNLTSLKQYTYVDAYLTTDDFAVTAHQQLSYLDTLFFKYLLSSYQSKHFLSTHLYDKYLELFDICPNRLLNDCNFGKFIQLYDYIYYDIPKGKIDKFIIMLKKKVEIIEKWWIEQMYKPNSTYVKKTLTEQFNEKIKMFTQ